MATDKDKPIIPPPVIITEQFQRREMFAAMFVHASLSRPLPPELAQIPLEQRQALRIESAVNHADALIKKLDAKP